MSTESDVQAVLDEAVAAPVEQAEVPAESAPVDQSDDTSAAPETPDESPELKEIKKQSRGVQKRIDELVRQRVDAERNAQAWREQAFNVAQVLQKSGQQQQPQQPAQQQINPQQFATYEAYLEAVGRKTAAETAVQATDAIVNQRFAQHQQAQQQAQLQQQAQAVIGQAQAKINAVKAEFPDFDEVVEDGEQYLRGPGMAAVALAVASSPVGGKMWYHLNKNPQLAQEIANAPETVAMYKLGQLESLVNSAVKPVSSAPKPGKPAGSRSNPVSGFREDMSPKEFDQWLKSGGG